LEDEMMKDAQFCQTFERAEAPELFWRKRS
jgi:hypothetical protein